MVKVRLFAQAADLVKDSVVEIKVDSLDDVRERLIQEYGQDMAKVLATSQIWLNGEPATGSGGIQPADEVAIIPPVSGG